MIFAIEMDSFIPNEKSRSFTMSDDVLSFLMKQPLPSSADLKQAPGHSGSQQMSFSEPFVNPDMEPLPLGPPSSRTSQPPQPKSVCVENGFQPFIEEAIRADLSQNLYSLLFPSSSNKATTDSKRNKRALDGTLSSDSTAFLPKRQRTSSTSDETVVRFRPYQEKQWNGMYQKLVQYQHKHGHCCVPHSYKEDPMLARWVKRQRYQRTKFEDNDPTSTMTAHRIQQLDAIGFVWHSHASAWQTKFNELTAFRHRMGHCNVPSHYPENVPLSTWVRSQRRHYQLWKAGCQSTMTTNRFEQLTSLGFVFESPTKTVGTQRVEAL